MIARFKDIFVSRESQFSVGIDQETNEFYVSFLVPTSNRQSDYEVFYQLPKEYENFVFANPLEISAYVDECRHGQHQSKFIA